MRLADLDLRTPAKAGPHASDVPQPRPRVPIGLIFFGNVVNKISA